MESYDIDKVNFDLLARKHVYEQGTHISVEKMYTEENKKNLKPFNDLPDVLPIRLKQVNQEHAGIVEEVKEASQFLPGGENEAGPFSFQDDMKTAEKQAEFRSKFELIKTRKLDYSKPLCIIYNPNSGTMTNMIPLIEQRLHAENIPFELMSTKKAGDTYEFALDLEINNYSMIIAAGGDGSFHEVVNGMLARPDGLKLPIGMIPNGSGNDTCSSMGVITLDHALDYIVGREVVQVDTVRCLIDHEKEADISPEDRMKFCRHMVINGAVSLPALVANEAAKYKGCCGKMCYTVATLESSILGKIQ